MSNWATFPYRWLAYTCGEANAGCLQLWSADIGQDPEASPSSRTFADVLREGAK